MDTQTFEDDETKEFDFYLQWEWPAHIEESLRRMLWISLVEVCEPGMAAHRHTALLRWEMANYPDSPPAVLDFLAKFDEPELLVRIAENPKTSPVTLARLARHELSKVRVAVAENDSIPFFVMKTLAADECPDVCYALAENPAVPLRLLHQIATNDNPYVAGRAARTLARRVPRAPEQFPLWHRQRRKAK